MVKYYDLYFPQSDTDDGLKKLNTLLIMTVFLLLWLGILTIVKVLFYHSSDFEWGSISDWISAVCNIAMAGAAVYAALQAKKWFKNKKYELGHSSARDLFLTLFKMNPVLDNLSTHVEMFNASSDAETDIEKIENILSEFYILIASYEKSIFELKGVGWEFKDKYYDIYNLPTRVDIEFIPLSAKASAVSYLYDVENKCEEIKYSSRELESSIKELLDITQSYNSAIIDVHWMPSSALMF
ncbi:hypothetical protein I4P27_21495 [Enterobacter roggenkampii]|nr:hypothetical protein [Enterobacter roggenkampii]